MFGLGGLAELRGLFRDVDSNRTPGDTPSAADASGGSELLVPRGELVGHPLSVSRGPGGADVLSGHIREFEGEAGAPTAPALRVCAGQIRMIVDVVTEAGGADHRAVSAGQAPLCNLLPLRTFDAGGQQFRKLFGIDPAPHVFSGAVDEQLERGVARWGWIPGVPGLGAARRPFRCQSPERTPRSTLSDTGRSAWCSEVRSPGRHRSRLPPAPDS